MSELQKVALASSGANRRPFSDDPRKIHEENLRPAWERILRKAFGSDITIEWHEGDVQDKELGVDVTLTLENGMPLKGQTKSLRGQNAKFNTLTVEYYQNRRTKEIGDWFKGCYQFYTVGYSTKECSDHKRGCACDEIGKAIIANWASLVIATNQGRVRWKINHTVRGRSSFKYVLIDNIPDDCIFYRQESESVW